MWGLCLYDKARINIRCHSSVSELCSISNIQHVLKRKEASAVEIAQFFIKRRDSKEAQLNNFIAVTDDLALQQAKQIDRSIALQDPIPPLAAVPIALKDNICTAGVQTTAGSGILSGYLPPYDAHVVTGLRKAGSLNLGKTNMDQFGMGSTTENSAFQTSRNPWDVSRVPGGSSGGSASAVASGQVIGALGTDTGGSIRLPAHFCGVVGMKPSYGLVSRYGLIAYASSLDVIGPFAKSVKDVAFMLDAVTENDSFDATNQSGDNYNFSNKLISVEQLEQIPLRGIKVGVVKETRGGSGVDTLVQNCLEAAIQKLTDLGAVVDEISMPAFATGLPAYYIIATAEASSNLSRYDSIRYGQQLEENDLMGLYKRSRGEGFSDEVKRRILMGTYTLSAGYYDAYYKKAQKVRRFLRRQFQQVLDQYDVLLTPPAPSLAPTIGANLSDPLSMYKLDLMTVNVNLAGLPSIVLPYEIVTTENGTRLPCGVQFIGKYMGDSQLLSIAHIFESFNPFKYDLEG